MQLTPIGNRVVLKETKQENVVKGIMLLESTQRQKNYEVVAIGNIQDLPLQVGNIVLIEKYKGQEISVNDETYIVIDSNYVIAIL